MSWIPDCREMSRRLSAARDTGRLGFADFVHLAMCGVCRRLRAQLSALAAAARVSCAPGGLSPEAKLRLRRALEES